MDFDTVPVMSESRGTRGCPSGEQHPYDGEQDPYRVRGSGRGGLLRLCRVRPPAPVPVGVVHLAVNWVPSGRQSGWGSAGDTCGQVHALPPHQRNATTVPRISEQASTLGFPADDSMSPKSANHRPRSG